ncbi:hypothetical protein ACJMK2_029033 [Sinanodonta woodiana]|uniref:C1q domain-containing protein n=1 Tax=Sinanodonta woodiana TaxID=1069815 RepID=A0ABD3XAS1_SINWO
MMTRNDRLRITGLIICIIATPVHTTVLEQENVIKFILQKVAELEKNQQECSSYQTKMLMELTYVKNKLIQSERRISELEVIVHNMKSDEYNDKMSLTMHDDSVDQQMHDNTTKYITEERNVSRARDLKRMHPPKLGITRRAVQGNSIGQFAFCATFAELNVQIRANEIIRFNTVLHNVGNGYSKETGFFTCPLSGTYFFSVSLMTSLEYTTYVHLVVNGQVKGNSYAHLWDQGSISCIVRCEAGQNVWISVYEGTLLYGNYYTSFSGFLLYGDATGSI